MNVGNSSASHKNQQCHRKKNVLFSVFLLIVAYKEFPDLPSQQKTKKNPSFDLNLCRMVLVLVNKKICIIKKLLTVKNRLKDDNNIYIFNMLCTQVCKTWMEYFEFLAKTTLEIPHITNTQNFSQLIRLASRFPLCYIEYSHLFLPTAGTVSK